MTISETKANDAMRKTENTMDDASECVTTRTCGSHAPNLMRPHDDKPVAPEQSKDPCNAHRWQQMMRSRVGIDTSKSWDLAEEEEETATPIVTFASKVKLKLGSSPMLLSIRLRGGAAEGELGQESGEESGNEGSQHASAHGQEGGGDGTLTEGGLPRHASAHGQEGGGDGTLTEGGLPRDESTVTDDQRQAIRDALQLQADEVDVREVRDYVLEALGVKLSKKVLVSIIEELLDEENAAAAAAAATHAARRAEIFAGSMLVDKEQTEGGAGCSLTKGGLLDAAAIASKINASSLERTERERAAHAERQRQQPPEMLIDFESLRKLERKAESMGYGAAAYWDERVADAKEICPEWLAELREEFDGETRLTAEDSALGSQAPSLRDYRNKAKRTRDSLPARFYRMMTGEEWDGEAHSYSKARKKYRRWEEPYQQRERERQQRKKRDYSKKKRPADDNARRQARRKAQREREEATMVASTPRLASAHGQEGGGGGTLTEGGLPLHASAHGQDGGGGGGLTEGGLPLHASAHGQEGGGGGTLTEGGLPLHASAHGQEGSGGGSPTEGGLPLHASAHGQKGGGGGGLTEGGLRPRGGRMLRSISQISHNL